ncbi:hypothetical protein [Deinococcus pimensis]|uniref:hypothetical protein n=1 Tax=Deinococcus pimensis TaxID=309888 RepID=UPI0004842EE3|nr:hypothetical protein [Deinococcus pimensis]
MSVSASFYLGSPDGLVSHFLSGPLDDFEHWYAERLEKHPDFLGRRVLNVIRQVRQGGRDALAAASTRVPWMVDETLSWYYGLFTDTHLPPDGWKRAAVPTIRRDEIVKLEKALVDRGLTETAELVTFILTGRPVLRDPEVQPFVPDDPQSPPTLAFWTLEEVERLHDLLGGLREAERLVLDPGWGALPTLLDAVNAARQRRAGVIVITTGEERFDAGDDVRLLIDRPDLELRAGRVGFVQLTWLKPFGEYLVRFDTPDLTDWTGGRLPASQLTLVRRPERTSTPPVGSWAFREPAQVLSHLPEGYSQLLLERHEDDPRVLYHTTDVPTSMLPWGYRTIGSRVALEWDASGYAQARALPLVDLSGPPDEPEP